MGNKKDLSPAQRKELIGTLKVRFEINMNRHISIDWSKVQSKLEADSDKLWSLNEMESTGGEPDVVGLDKRQGNTYFTTVLLNAQKTADVFVTTGRHLSQEKNLNQKIMQSMPLSQWV